MRRIALLALRFNRASKARFALLAISAAVGISLFLIVSELSRLSSEDLRASIAAEAGRTGTYAIDLGSTFGMGPRSLASGVGSVTRRYAAQPVQMLEIIPAVPIACPPDTSFGSQPLIVPYGAAGLPVDRPEARPSIAGTACIGGQEVPASAVRPPSPAERTLWFGAGSAGSSVGFVLRGEYERLALLTTTDPVSYRFVVTTGRDADLSFALFDAVTQALRSAAQRYGAPHVESAVVVTRLDTGQGIRRAAAGVDLVYGIVAWAFLVLAGLGLLVAETIVVRDRMWFFGLSRAVGARGRDVAALVIVDIVLVLVAASGLALALLLALGPVAASFAHDAFQVTGVSFLKASVVPRLLLGGFLVLVLAAAYPAAKAVRQDPLDVLEPRVS